MTRVPTGIPGLDDLIGGGFMEGSNVLVSGGTGTGKTILATQYIYKGAEQYGDPGIYISMEEGATNLWWNMKSFKWNLTKYEQDEKIKVYRVGMIEPKDFALRFDEEIDRIKKMVDKMGAKRLVVDSTTAFAMWIGSDPMIRYSLFKLADELKEMKCTTLMTAETLGERNQFSRFGVEEFVSDAVVSLYFMPPQRAIFVRKMRGSRHDQKIHPYEITENGITVDSREEVMWESLNR
ncbi:MAG: ATPase domain-containing protein [Candidatus Micrarchaeota archaeon]